MINTFFITLWYIIRKTSTSLDAPSVAIFTSPEVIVSIILVAIVGVLFLPICGLTVFHFTLVIRGRTTNEQVTGKFKRGVNPYDLGCWMNSSQTLCLSQYPIYRKQPVTDLSTYTEAFINNKQHAEIDNKMVVVQIQNGITQSVLSRNIPTNEDADFISEKRSPLSSSTSSSPGYRKSVSSTQRSKDQDFIKPSANRRHETNKFDPNRFKARVTVSTNQDQWQEHPVTKSLLNDQESQIDERFLNVIETSEKEIDSMEMMSFMTHNDEDTIDRISNGYSNGTTINDLGSMNNQFGVSSDEDQASQIHLPDSQEDLINSSSISINYITDHSPSKDLGHKNSSKDEDVIYSQTLKDATKEILSKEEDIDHKKEDEKEEQFHKIVIRSLSDDTTPNKTISQSQRSVSDSDPPGVSKYSEDSWINRVRRARTQAILIGATRSDRLPTVGHVTNIIGRFENCANKVTSQKNKFLRPLSKN